MLEARDRVGGRIVTDRRYGLATDLGASWIHGITDSPVAAAAEAFGMRMVEFTVGGYQPDSRPIAYYGPDGRRLSDAAARSFIDDIHAVDATLLEVVAASGPDASYRDVTDEAIARYGWDEDRAQRVREYLEHRSEEQYGAWIEDLAAHGLDDDSDRRRRGGVSRRLRPPSVTARRGPRHPPHPCRRRSVRWSADGVTVTTDRGTFTADNAVVTVPVGVLQSDDFVIEPPLPEPVAGALGRLKMNAFEKVFLRFPTKFWDDGVYAIRQQGPESRWWHSWYDLTALHDTPTLLTFAAGPAAVETRDWTEEEIVDSVLAQLRRLYGDRVEKPTHVHITDWQDDPFAHGSYAYMTVGSTTADHDILATPVGGVLHLAGEATWTDDPATVTAAHVLGSPGGAEHPPAGDPDR